MDVLHRHGPEEPDLLADPTAQLRLLDLQAVDAALDQLTHRLAHLPEAQALAELEARQAELAAARDRFATEVDDLSREQRKAEADVEQVKSRRARDRQRVDAGQIADPKQLQAIQHEIETLDRRITDLEDVELDVMERLEAAQTGLTDAEEELEQLDLRLATATRARDEVTSGLAEQQAGARSERDAVARDIPAPLLALYVRLRTQLGGIGAGALERKRCTGCQLDVNAAELAQMAAAPPDEVLRCENCDRILVRTPESGL